MIEVFVCVCAFMCRGVVCVCVMSEYIHVCACVCLCVSVHVCVCVNVHACRCAINACAYDVIYGVAGSWMSFSNADK